jgi:RNA polymerase sigma-70 factor, ECF subfamily
MSDLVRGLQAGDARAYERLVRDYGDRLWRFVRRMVGVRPAEDITQEVFVRVHRSVGSFEPGGRFDAWIFAIASNLCVDHLRRERPMAPLDDLPEPATDPRPSGPLSAVEEDERRRALARAVDLLPPEQKQVFLLRQEAGLPFKEIARLMSCPLNTALGRMHYAMEHLRASLQAYRD